MEDKNDKIKKYGQQARNILKIEKEISERNMSFREKIRVKRENDFKHTNGT